MFCKKKLSKILEKNLYYTNDLCAVKGVGYRCIELMYYTQNNGEINCCGYKVIKFDYRFNLGGIIERIIATNVDDYR